MLCYRGTLFLYSSNFLCCFYYQSKKVNTQRTSKQNNSSNKKKQKKNTTKLIQVQAYFMFYRCDIIIDSLGIWQNQFVIRSKIKKKSTSEQKMITIPLNKCTPPLKSTAHYVYSLSFRRYVHICGRANVNYKKKNKCEPIFFFEFSLSLSLSFWSFFRPV